METLSIHNPFGAPVYFKETVTSTMDEARLLKSHASGTVITADKQTMGRGRSGRPWQTTTGESLSFTIMLHYGNIAAIPPCLTLKAGLAVTAAIEDFASLVQGVQVSPMAGRVVVKWPNDVMLLDETGRGRKAVGILTEAENGTVYIGIGVNLARQSFPPELAKKACSIAQMLAAKKPSAKKPLIEQRFILLEKILSCLYKEMEKSDSSLQERLEERLYMKGQRVCFIPGVPEELSAASRINPEKIEGILQGIGEGGEILITLDSGETLSFITGELKIY